MCDTKPIQQIYHKSEELSKAVPNVIYQRLNMFVWQNILDNQQELAEMERMVMEKPFAFWASWQKMWIQSYVAQQNISTMMTDGLFKMLTWQPVYVEDVWQKIQQETLKVIEKGIDPIHETAIANAKRLKD